MINGVTQLVMTKADVLDELEILKVAEKYIANGKETRQIPFQMDRMEIVPIYKEFAGWKQDITTIKNYKDLPGEMAAYIKYINTTLGIPVNFISNGPGTDQLIVFS
jgi:adenylosuccinate synthase